MAPIIKDTEWTDIADGVKPDSRRRVVLPNILVQKGITYRIYHNRKGQIVLDPQVTISASELWLFENKEALASIDKAMTEEQVIKRGSFAKYVKDAA